MAEKSNATVTLMAGGEHSRLHPRMAATWKAAGIDVISLASNHTPDWGPDSLLDTIELFRGMGKHVIGAGRNIEEARRPAIVEQLHGDIVRGLRETALRAQFVRQGAESAPENTPDGFMRLMRAEYLRCQALIRQGAIKPE